MRRIAYMFRSGFEPPCGSCPGYRWEMGFEDASEYCDGRQDGDLACNHCAVAWLPNWLITLRIRFRWWLEERQYKRYLKKNDPEFYKELYGK